MKFKDLFNSKKVKENFEFLKVDMHNHLLPGVDDGCKNIAESIQIIEEFNKLGYQKLIFTPHVKTGIFENTKEDLRQRFQNTLAQINSKFPNMEFALGAEYFLDDHFLQLIEMDELLSFSDRYVLMEFSFRFEPILHKTAFFKLQEKEYKPILAHFERYPYFHGSLDKAIEFREAGVNIQMNLNSLSGHYGPQVRKQAEKMLNAGVVDFVGSDCHRLQHLDVMQTLLSSNYISKIKQLKLKNKEL